MTTYFLDTNHLGHAIRVVSPVRERILKSRRQGVRFACCWPVLCELEAGIVQMKGTPRYRRFLKTVLKEVRIWPQDANMVKTFGEVHLLLKQRGRALSHVDKVLAAFAMTGTNVTILTTDSDFCALPEIRTANWLS